MKCKTLTVVVNGYIDGAYEEYQFPEIDKYLEDGYLVSDVYQIAPQASNSHNVVLTFILKK